ncbi:MAG: aromatic amino acid transport family protein, partial [Phormidesmis sp.]
MSSLFSRIFAQLASDNQIGNQTDNQTPTDVDAKQSEGEAGQEKSGETRTKPKKPGSVFGSAALIAGTTVGAGVLALPAVTLPVGLLPSTALMVAAWLYMLVSGLLIAEANLQAMRQTGSADVGLLATVRLSLGKRGAIAAGIVYIFIHYALLVAYVARAGDILADSIA